MSHFFTAVLVPKGIKDREGFVSDRLAPYDENREVAPYDEECYCVNLIAADEAREATIGQMGTIDDLRYEFGKLNIDRGSKEADEEWDKLIEPWKVVEAFFLDIHPLKGKPDSDCDECKGTGTRKTTYNPDSKWDWWVVGGRWDGAISGKERKDKKDGGFNFGDSHHQVKFNVASVDTLLALPAKEFSERCPFAVVDKVGVWYEKGKMGWWGMTRDEKEEDSWFTEVRKIYAVNRDCVVIGCDLHI